MFIIFLYCIQSILSSFINCPEQIQQDCDQFYTPVCAYNQDEKVSKVYLYRFMNNIIMLVKACKLSTTKYYQEGKCKQLIHYNQIYRLISESNGQSDFIKHCDESIRFMTDCSNKQSQVCGIYVKTVNSTSVQRQYYNSCVACADTIVDYYYDGYCRSELTLSEIIYCPADRPFNCDENGQSVCSQTTCILESKSWCQACSNNEVVSYYQGSCQQYLEFVKNIDLMEQYNLKHVQRLFKKYV